VVKRLQFVFFLIWRKMKNKYLWVAVIIGSTIALDQYTKLLVMQRFRLYESVAVIPGFFNLTYVRNKGAAFGILAGMEGAWRTAFFVMVSLAALSVLTVLVRKTEDRLTLIAYALISGGALGNLVDRIRFGEVVDFVEWYYRSFHWPAFNVADSAITVGVGLLVIEMLFFRNEDPVNRKT
jgi:signal peptidase II